MAEPQPQPISLSDAAMTALMAAARPLPTPDRDTFLRLVAAQLNGRCDIVEAVRSIASSARRSVRCTGRRRAATSPTASGRASRVGRRSRPSVLPCKL
jgi:hypothetical protein